MFGSRLVNHISQMGDDNVVMWSQNLHSTLPNFGVICRNVSICFRATGKQHVLSKPYRNACRMRLSARTYLAWYHFAIKSACAFQNGHRKANIDRHQTVAFRNTHIRSSNTFDKCLELMSPASSNPDKKLECRLSHCPENDGPHCSYRRGSSSNFASPARRVHCEWGNKITGSGPEQLAKTSRVIQHVDTACLASCKRNEYVHITKTCKSATTK